MEIVYVVIRYLIDINHQRFLGATISVIITSCPNFSFSATMAVLDVNSSFTCMQQCFHGFTKNVQILPEKYLIIRHYMFNQGNKIALNTTGTSQGLKLTLNVETEEYMSGPASGSGAFVSIQLLMSLLFCPLLSILIYNCQFLSILFAFLHIYYRFCYMTLLKSHR